MAPLVSLLFFLFTVFVYIIFQRQSFGKTNMIRNIIVFFSCGFLCNAFGIFYFIHQKILDTTALPITAIILYGFISLAFIVVSATPLLGDESPSSKILLMVNKKNGIAFSEIKKFFSTNDLILKRLDDLRKQSWIEKKNHMYYILPVGTMIAKIVSIYRKLLDCNLIG
jgi:hypothetical protein